MQSLTFKSLLCGSLLLTALTAQAQIYGPGRYGDDDRYDRDDRGYRRDGQYYRRGAPSFDRIHADLRYAESHSYRDRGERKRIDKAREELREFQRAWNSGRFDRHELDDTIGAIQKVIDHGEMRYRDREILQADVESLREFREMYRDYGARRW